MTRPIMRRLLPLVFLCVSTLVPAARPASAQETAEIRLTLLAQTPWNTPTQRDLELRIRAENLGTEPLEELDIGVTLYSRILSRSAYEASLVTDPSVVIDAETLPREGTLEPGASREFEISVTLDSAGIDPEHSGVYPFKVDLRSGLSPVAVLRTPAIFLVREPEIPLVLSWTFVLHHPISFRPDGTFVDDSLETSLDAGGRLNGQIRSLLEVVEDPAATPVDVAISPVLLTQLGRMRDGYTVDDDGAVREVAAGQGGATLAGQAIEDLQTIAADPNVVISSLPFSTPELPALFGGGLQGDARTQLERGRDVTSVFVQEPTVDTVFRPPGAALDDATLRALPVSGIETLILGPTTVALPEQPLGFAGPGTVLVGDGSLSAIVPEPSADAQVASIVEDDPVRAAQVLLGQLTNIWQERPGEEHGVAIVLGEDVPYPGPFFRTLAGGVPRAPWLAPTHAETFVAAFPPTDTASLAQPSFRRFTTSYVASLKQARRRIETVRSMLPERSEEPARLETLLLLAEARQFLVAEDAGLAFISSVRSTVDGIIGGLELETVSAVTLTSDAGSVPLTVRNTGNQRLSISVRLVSQYLRHSPSVDLELAPGESRTLRLQVQLRTTGRFPIRVQLLSPSGRVIGQDTLIVRSTAYNRVALLITIGAALVLLLVWARRFVPRRTP